jgi:hypothetical protein
MYPSRTTKNAPSDQKFGNRLSISPQTVFRQKRHFLGVPTA